MFFNICVGERGVRYLEPVKIQKKAGDPSSIETASVHLKCYIYIYPFISYRNERRKSKGICRQFGFDNDYCTLKPHD